MKDSKNNRIDWGRQQKSEVKIKEMLFVGLWKWGYKRPIKQTLQIQHFSLEKMKALGTIHPFSLWAYVKWRVPKSFHTNG